LAVALFLFFSSRRRQRRPPRARGRVRNGKAGAFLLIVQGRCRHDRFRAQAKPPTVRGHRPATTPMSPNVVWVCGSDPPRRSPQHHRRGRAAAAAAPRPHRRLDPSLKKSATSASSRREPVDQVAPARRSASSPQDKKSSSKCQSQSTARPSLSARRSGCGRSRPHSSTAPQVIAKTKSATSTIAGTGGAIDLVAARPGRRRCCGRSNRLHPARRRGEKLSARRRWGHRTACSLHPRARDRVVSVVHAANFC
jgi:hypothetical protein